jgi:hypothetical protein
MGQTGQASSLAAVEDAGEPHGYDDEPEADRSSPAGDTASHDDAPPDGDHDQ